MKNSRTLGGAFFKRLCVVGLGMAACALPCVKADLAEVKAAGVLRHIGIPYANFVSGAGDGLDVELMQQFAATLGVRYEYVPADWPTLFPDLLGRKVSNKGGVIEDAGPTPVKADVAANGITVLGWREKIVDFSEATFPTQVWLIARKSSSLMPIKPTGNLDQDIEAVKQLLAGKKVFCKSNTCLAPELYNLEKVGATTMQFPGSLNDLAPAVIAGEAEFTLLDVPDTLVALKKWPGEIKVIGPVGPVQDMAVAFPKDSPKLREAFNEFYRKLVADGSYRKMVEKYYPYAFRYFPGFFAPKQ